MLGASQALWDKYHEEIEAHGYTLSNDSFNLGIDKSYIVAAIRPNYPSKMFDVFREIIPMDFEHEEETVGVIISPSINDYVNSL